ncbi:MAG: transcription termination/antitermination protein NusG [Acidimicrobiales bacterium]|nr:transcription termination/antitermination protein NusG [Acidimicrobiales bacterium]
MSDFLDQSDQTSDEDGSSLPLGEAKGAATDSAAFTEAPRERTGDESDGVNSSGESPGHAPGDVSVSESQSTIAGEVEAGDGELADVADGALEPGVLTEDELFETEEVAWEESPYDRPGRWYVVHTQSGYEKKVKQNLEARITSMNMEERIYEVVIPMEDVVEFKGGKKVVVPKKMFPGYLLVRCELDDDSWYVIRNTPGVTGFVGQGAKPSPLPRKDVEMFLQVDKGPEAETVRKGKPRLEYEVGETVRIKEGPFADFSGEIVDLNEEQLKVKVEVDIFGRPTPVELEFSQIAKL